MKKYYWARFVDGSSKVVYAEQSPFDNNYACQSCTSGFNSEEELRKHCRIHGPCKECGYEYATTYTNGEDLIKNNLCFTCDFWTQYANNKDNESYLRIDGQHYVVCTGNNGPFNGYGGRRFHIEKNGKLIITNDLWHQGVIPEHFRERLPDNAKFIERPKPVGHGQGYLS